MSDQRVTLYALGELNGPEREAFEKHLAASPQLQHELQETITLAEALQSQPLDAAFTPEERAALRDQCVAQLKISRRRLTIRRIVTVSAVAATLMVAAGLLIFSSSEEEKTALLASEAPALAATPISMTLQASAETTASALTAKDALQNQLTDQVAEEGIAKADVRTLSVPDADSNANLPPAATSQPVKQFTASWAISANGLSANALPAQEGYIDYGSPITTTAAPAPMSAPMASRSFRKAGDAAIFSSVSKAESYTPIEENTFLAVTDQPLSTFSIDVDTASYANVRRFLQSDQLPPPVAIRTEELINYFTYDYPRPQGDSPFSVNLEVSHAPWDIRRELVRIGLRGRELPTSERAPANLVFLIDVSGSMNEPSKLPLLQKSLRGLVENLSPEDHVAIVVYAGSSGLVLPSTKGTEKRRIIEALSDLRAGGSTNGGDGIRLAYETARQHFVEGGNNRVILCTDGDFNVGTTSQDELVRLIEKERASGVFLSVLGFGTGNLKDSTMEKLADKGNGNYAYIDSLSEGRKVLVDQMGATLFTIAKDVKIQVEFNPARVAGYRLIGYENRLMAKEDFNDDKKDAGEIGAGHTVTALYEIIPAGTPLPDHPSVDPLKYQKPEPAATPALTGSGDFLTVKLRYKAPDGDKSQLLEIPLAVNDIPAFEQASPDFQFSAAVAAFAMKLRNSPAAGKIQWADLQKITRRTLGDDPGSYRAEFLTLVEKAARLSQPDKE